MMSGGRDRADWVRNIVARAALHGRDRRHELRRLRARSSKAPSEDELARTLVHDKYAHGDDLTGWRATALPIAIDLTPAD